VRYISHEIRTPLNAAFLGLKILMDDLKKSTNAKDVDRFDTLSDVNLSCVTAIDILNDLLSFEKLESGILTLNTETVSVLPFVEECVNLFAAQAKSNEMSLLFNPAGMGNAVNGVDGAGADGRSASISARVAPGTDEVLPLLTSDEVTLDKFKMAQVVRNLISNALKFSPPGGTVTVVASFVPDGPAAHIADPAERKKPIDLEAGEGGLDSAVKASVGATPGRLRVVVTDSGAGISPENQKKLFKDVVQFNPEKLQAGGGSGFGLFISKGIVDLHSGTISVYSAGEGQGCSFTIEIPMQRSKRVGDSSPSNDVGISVSRDITIARVSDKLASNVKESLEDAEELEAFRPAEAVEKAAVEPAPDTTPRTPRTPRYKILVVDDSKLNRKMLCKVLTEAGHSCEEAADGLRAVEKVTASQKEPIEYDAILMDFMMPNLDGPGATRRIRDMGYKSAIFGVTGNGLQSDIDHFVSNGADKVFVKPFDVDGFHRTMAGRTRKV
jgi:signal transduction histidine kinase/ActR/RegA family two-component response regulator